jgi:DGQHR domain-containing protein
MKYFFAENCDMIDPGYDFIKDETQPNRVVHTSDEYPHEHFETPPYDGLLVSKAIVGGDGFSGKYTPGQRYRLLREGIRKYLRYPHQEYDGDPMAYPIMGDCGSFSYIDRDKPPISNEDMIGFYSACGFTHAVSIDHIITENNLKWDDLRRLPSHIEARAEFTFSSAVEFLRLCRDLQVGFEPIGVVQCWSPRSAAHYAQKLVEAGYQYIGIGGMVGHNWEMIFNVLSEVRATIPKDIQIHMFGFTNIKKVDQFIGLDITSFDSTAPVLKAFKDDKENYFVDTDPHYTAVRISPADEAKINRRIQSGQLDQDRVHELEVVALNAVRAYDVRKLALEETLDAIMAYEQYLSPNKNFRHLYSRTLRDRPWESCSCRVCRETGIEVIIYRRLNRNKRRGFHNLFYLYQHINKVRNTMNEIKAPCIRTQQCANKVIYSFVVDGKKISQFASISRISRNDSGNLLGYQRPEVQDHIKEIRTYLEREDAILPNSIVIAFQRGIHFDEITQVDKHSSLGTLRIQLLEDEKVGWIVDGQQRVAALRSAKKEHMPISVIGFESTGTAEEREQFLLVNSTKPLSKSLVYELLPNIDGHIPPKMKKRRDAYIFLEKLNLDVTSPFYMRIKTTTSKHLETAHIKDMSVLKMLEHSMKDGILFRFHRNVEKASELLHNYWSAVKETYGEAWELPPKKSRLTHGVGIVSMGYIMDTMGYKLVRKGKVPTVDQFSKELRVLGKDVPWLNGLWHFSDDIVRPWNSLQNTTYDIDLVTNHLVRMYQNRVA